MAVFASSALAHASSSRTWSMSLPEKTVKSAMDAVREIGATSAASWRKATAPARAFACSLLVLRGSTAILPSRATSSTSSHAPAARTSGRPRSRRLRERSAFRPRIVAKGRMNRRTPETPYSAYLTHAAVPDRASGAFFGSSADSGGSSIGLSGGSGGWTTWGRGLGFGLGIWVVSRWSLGGVGSKATHPAPSKLISTHTWASRPLMVWVPFLE